MCLQILEKENSFKKCEIIKPDRQCSTCRKPNRLTKKGRKNKMKCTLFSQSVCSMNLWLVTCVVCTAVFHNRITCLKEQKFIFPLRFYSEQILVYFTKTIKKNNKIRSSSHTDFCHTKYLSLYDTLYSWNSSMWKKTLVLQTKMNN